MSALFPFEWSGAYLPRITTQLLEYIGCPGALLVGCHDDTVKEGHLASSPPHSASQGYSTLRTSDSASPSGGDTANASLSNEEDGLMYLVQQLNPEDLVIVDLDHNRVIQPRDPYDADIDDAITFESLPRSAGMVTF